MAETGKTIATIAIVIIAAAVEGWIWARVSQPLLPLVIVALAGAGAIGLVRRSRALTWAGLCAAWSFYLPVLLAIFQVSIGMALIYGGLLAFLYGIWSPLLSLEATSWLVRGRISGLQPLQPAAPALILLGFLLLALGLAQVVRARLRGAGPVTDGLYSLVRHPQYLGVSILTLGFVLYGLRPIDFIAWANLVLLQLILAGAEEAKLQERFGRSYASYRERVPFILPFLPRRLRQRFGGVFPAGWKRKLAIALIYLLVMVALIVSLWFAWQASGGMLMR